MHRRQFLRLATGVVPILVAVPSLFPSAHDLPQVVTQAAGRYAILRASRLWNMGWTPAGGVLSVHRSPDQVLHVWAGVVPARDVLVLDDVPLILGSLDTLVMSSMVGHIEYIYDLQWFES